MFIGINLNHDASTALLGPNGHLVYALAEERISRIKNHFGIPKQSLAIILEIYKKQFHNVNANQLRVIIGSHAKLSTHEGQAMVA